MQHEILIAPSVLSADFTIYGAELDSVASADYIHYDVMDGHFVPNLSYGIEILRQTKAATKLPLDVHLMISNPEERAMDYIEAGADILCFHQEASLHTNRLIAQIHEAGAKAAISLCPATPVSVLENIIEDIDMVLIMSVNPGFGGQSFLPMTYDKLRALRRLANEHGVNPRVEVDGGITAENAGAICEAGADVLVAGSSVFNAKDRAAAIQELRHAGEQGRN